jgi:hypothetical protein
MEKCAFCKIENTELYENGVPICLDCSRARDQEAKAVDHKPSIKSEKADSADAGKK